jgi:hypothetical protein
MNYKAVSVQYLARLQAGFPSVYPRSVEGAIARVFEWRGELEQKGREE